MPLTDKGKKIMKNMKKTYGSEEGERVFYASANKGKIKGVHGKSKRKGKGEGKSKGGDDLHWTSSRSEADAALKRRGYR